MIGPLALALLLSGAHAERAAGVKWERDFDEAQKKARAASKPLLVDFWADWCGWCHRLDRTTYMDPRVVELSASFVPVKVNTDGSPRDVAVASRYGVETLPTIIVLSPSGRPILRVSGFEGPGQFPLTLAQARDAAAQLMGWEAALQKNPKDAAALAALGQQAFDIESYDDSLDLLARAVAVDGALPAADRKRTRMLLAVLRKHAEKYPEAEALLKEALAIKSAEEYDAKLLYVLARTYLAWGRTDDARRTLKEIVASHADSVVAERARETLVALDRR